MATIGTVRLVSWCSQISKQRLSLLGCQFSEPYVFKRDSVSLRALGGFFFSLIGYGWKLPQAAEFKQPWGTCLCWVESESRSEGKNLKISFSQSVFMAIFN